MILIFPLSHEDQIVRRIPICTIIIIVICLLIQMFSSFIVKKNMEIIQQKLEALTNYYKEHPNLEFPNIFNNNITSQQWIERNPESKFLTKEEQEFNKLIIEFLKEKENSFYYRYGYLPGKFNLSIITYQFVHGGWIHLITNMWFLWLAATVIEDLWGRLFFTIFYLFCGAFSAFVHSIFFANSSEPLIGASGAIAGIMGAFS